MPDLHFKVFLVLLDEFAEAEITVRNLFFYFIGKNFTDVRVHFPEKYSAMLSGSGCPPCQIKAPAKENSTSSSIIQIALAILCSCFIMTFSNLFG
jgi:hypothetical protein